MDVFRLVSASACFLGIVITVFGSLYPSEKFGKQMKIIFSLIFILSVLKPVLGGKFDLSELKSSVSDSPGQFEEISENTYGYFIRSVESNISAALETELGKLDIYPEKIETSINISENGSISISEIRLVLDNAEQVADAENCIGNAVNGSAKIISEIKEKGDELAGIS